MPLAPPQDILTRTRILRMVHIDCLDTLVARDALHAPNCAPADGRRYIGIHATQTQADRGDMPVPCGPRGVIRDYVGFYFGPRSPMLYRVHTGYNVQQIDQANIVYLVSTAQAVADARIGFVFTDRHSLARVAEFKDRLDDLTVVDFEVAYAEYWRSTADEPDRQEKKQAEFLVFQNMSWNLLTGIAVLNEAALQRVNAILDGNAGRNRPPVEIRRDWYY